MARLAGSVDPIEGEQGFALIASLLTDGQLSHTEIIACLADLMIGAVDTVSS